MLEGGESIMGKSGRKWGTYRPVSIIIHFDMVFVFWGVPTIIYLFNYLPLVHDEGQNKVNHILRVFDT